jgi:hypothetical protein
MVRHGPECQSHSLKFKPMAKRVFGVETSGAPKRSIVNDRHTGSQQTLAQGLQIRHIKCRMRFL